MIINSGKTNIVIPNQFCIGLIRREYNDLKEECFENLRMLDEQNYDNGWISKLNNKIMAIDEKLVELSALEAEFKKNGAM